ncbi:MAG: hypothetical protein CMO98_03640 [Woeseia sp.]|nr:hypothetical protein [Woeseia sp.]|tara:strand:- start:3875 stop:4144 length:270 start_codon:yes stop_codon:yes gene_type:complete
MSADYQVFRLLLAAMAWLLVTTGTVVVAEETADSVELEFLEYLGSWEGSDKDWVLFTLDLESGKQINEKEVENIAAREREKAGELDDES